MLPAWLRRDPFLPFLLAGVLLGILGGAVLGTRMLAVEWIGRMFLAALRLLVIPLVMSTLITGIASLGDARRMGRTGVVTFLYFLVGTSLAVALGILLVTTLRPGEGGGFSLAEVPARIRDRAPVSPADLAMSLVSDNLVGAMVRMEILPLIVFSLFFGAALTVAGERARPLLAFFEGLAEVMLVLVRWLMALAPIGVFALVGTALGKTGGGRAFVEEVMRIGAYAGTVILGLLIHGIVVLPAILWLFGRRNPARYARDLADALLTAFSTASSNATLPLSLERAVERAGISRRSAYFVIPIGATVNMNGTALYEAVAAIFIAQACGIHLSGPDLLIVFVTATLAAIGAAGIPEAGLVTMVMVLTAVHLPVEGIGMILAVDWFLDRCRTTVNVWDDCVGAAIVDRLAGVPAPGAESPPSA